MARRVQEETGRDWVRRGSGGQGVEGGGHHGRVRRGGRGSAYTYRRQRVGTAALNTPH